MKQTITILLFLFINLQTAFSQISIDSVMVFKTGENFETSIDSIYISGCTCGPTLKRVQIGCCHLDACSQSVVVLYFKGCIVKRACEDVQGLFYDTMLVISSPMHSRFVKVFTFWDTIANCSYPLEPLQMDRENWTDCDVYTSTEQIEESDLSIYPNPTHDWIYIDVEENIDFTSMELIDITGKKVKDYEYDINLSSI